MPRLTPLLQPRSIAVIGASPKENTLGNNVVVNLLRFGYPGRIFPVHPSAPHSEGIPTTKTIAEVPGEAELLLLYVRPEVGLTIIDQAPAKGVRRVLLNPGSESAELVAKIGVPVNPKRW